MSHVSYLLSAFEFLFAHIIMAKCGLLLYDHIGIWKTRTMESVDQTYQSDPFIAALQKCQSDWMVWPTPLLFSLYRNHAF